jgi:hypothetical protein
MTLAYCQRTHTDSIRSLQSQSDPATRTARAARGSSGTGTGTALSPNPAAAPCRYRDWRRQSTWLTFSYCGILLEGRVGLRVNGLASTETQLPTSRTRFGAGDHADVPCTRDRCRFANARRASCRTRSQSAWCMSASCIHFGAFACPSFAFRSPVRDESSSGSDRYAVSRS